MENLKNSISKYKKNNLDDLLKKDYVKSLKDEKFKSPTNFYVDIS